MSSAQRRTVLVLSGKPAAIVAELATLAAQDRRAESFGSDRSKRHNPGKFPSALLSALETSRPAARDHRATLPHPIHPAGNLGRTVEV